jgi:GNAT superfamily N-acetyltransferase
VATACRVRQSFGLLNVDGDGYDAGQGMHCLVNTMANQPRAESALEFLDLTSRDLPDIFEVCCCIYWELPEQFEKRPGKERMRGLQERWFAKQGPGLLLGKVARQGKEVRGFIRFGPPEIYPQRLGYSSGPVSEDALLITCLFVAKPYRGLGIARRLLSLAEDAATRRYSYSAVETFARKGSANNPSGPVELWLKCGYEVLRDDDEFPLMRKLVQSSRGPGHAADN